MKLLALFLLLSSPALAAIDRIELDGKLISRTGNRMVVQIGKSRVTLPASRRVFTGKKSRNGTIRVSVLPSELPQQSP